MGTPKQLSVTPAEMIAIRHDLIQAFPNLQRETFDAVSEDSDEYNCIAWAAEVVDDRWWPHPDPNDAFWPISWRDDKDPNCFIEAFRRYGRYEPCGNDFSLENGYEKVALYVLGGAPKHMARQLPDGRWVSKCGVYGWDIIHESVKGVEGVNYGEATLALRRSVSAT